MILSSEYHLFRFRGDNVNTVNELVNNVIWHSKPKSLNDPFEMFFSFDFESLKEKSTGDIATIIKDTKFLRENRRRIEECFIGGDLSFVYDHIYKYWGEQFNKVIIDEFHQSVAIACFTKKYDSRLMWGYYGSGMKGVCFVYNKEKLNKCGVEFADVVYSDIPPKIDIFKHLLEKLRSEKVTISAEFSLIKHTDWEKEEEVRSLKFFSTKEHYKHSPGHAVILAESCIDAVIIGARLTGDMRAFIEEYSKRNGIKLFIAKADFLGYKVDVSEVPL